MAVQRIRCIAWLLMGMTGSTPGVLELKDSSLSFIACGAGVLTKRQLRRLEQAAQLPGLAGKLLQGEEIEIFKAPLSSIAKAVFPWYYFGGGMIVSTGECRFRFSFLQPQNTRLPSSARLFQIGKDIIGGRAAGKAWKSVFGAR
jgi:hypothetical protein